MRELSGLSNWTHAQAAIAHSCRAHPALTPTCCKRVAVASGAATIRVRQGVNSHSGRIMPRLAFGGSFNPIHFGHLRCAQAVADRAGFDRVVLIPGNSPPHKPEQADLAPAEDRLAMCQ